MEYCFFCKKINKDLIKEKYKNRPDSYLNAKKNDCNENYKRNCCFGILSGAASVGSGIATGLSFATAAPGTIPASMVSGAVCVASIRSALQDKAKRDTIEDILNDRKNTEIQVVANKNHLTYIPMK